MAVKCLVLLGCNLDKVGNDFYTSPSTDDILIPPYFCNLHMCICMDINMAVFDFRYSFWSCCKPWCPCSHCIRACIFTSKSYNIFEQHSAKQVSQQQNKVENFRLYHCCIFAAQFYASVAMWCRCVCLSVRLSRLWIFVETNISSKCFSPLGSHIILVFPYQTSWQYSDWNPLNGRIECRWGRQKSQFWANIWLHRMLSTLRLPGVINTSLADHGKLWHLPLVVSGRACWWWETTMKYFMTRKSQRYAKDNRTAFSYMQW